MSRMKLAVAGLVLAAFTGMATAQTPYKVAACNPSSSSYKPGTPIVKTMIVGSSAMWNTLALGAYNTGKGPTGAIANTHHFVGVSNFNVVDTRPLAFGTGNAKLTDSGQTWVVWDEHTGYVAGTGTVCEPNVWVYVNTDSVVGNRSVLGSIGTPNATVGNFGIYVEAPSSWTGNGSAFLQPLWSSSVSGALVTDDTVPANIQAIFNPSNEGVAGAPNLVNVGATDIRPEDAFFAVTRVNSKYGFNTGSGSNENPDGLGYVNTAIESGSPNNVTSGAAPGLNPVCAGSGTTATVNDLVGTKIQGFETNGTSNSNGSASSFNVAAFNLTGNDPFTCATLPALHTIPVGAVPIVFIHSNGGGQLANLTNANEVELGQVFSGQNVNASAFNLPAAAIEAFLREPLSGTMNTTESCVFRHPSSLATYRQSQEANNGAVMPNPLNGTDTSAARFRAIGTSREVNAVKNAVANHTTDGIGYAFFSYGNVAPIGGQSAYSYIQLNGIDPIFHNYVPGTAGITDPGQPTTAGQLPLNTPCGTQAANTAFPCNENQIWANSKVATLGPTGAVTVFNSYSFPNLRNGSYPAWSVVRLVAGPAYLNATTLVNASQAFVVSTVPDYVPFAAVKTGTYPNYTYLDPGLTIVRSHYGCLVATCGLNFAGTAANTPAQGALERGRDAGGAILPIGDIKVNYTQDAPDGMVVFQ
jgi:hypothetical protein